MRYVDPKLTQSPSIKELNSVTPGGSIVILSKLQPVQEMPEINPEPGLL